jgi:hypothetical protein
MDIYKYAESINYAADYYDMKTGRIFKITEAKFHDGNIPVYEDGVCIGFAVKEEEKN